MSWAASQPEPDWVCSILVADRHRSRPARPVIETGFDFSDADLPKGRNLTSQLRLLATARLFVRLAREFHGPLIGRSSFRKKPEQATSPSGPSREPGVFGGCQVGANQFVFSKLSSFTQVGCWPSGVPQATHFGVAGASPAAPCLTSLLRFVSRSGSVTRKWLRIFKLPGCRLIRRTAVHLAGSSFRKKSGAAGFAGHTLTKALEDV